MAVLTVRPNGVSLIDPPAIDRPVTFGRRGIIQGWSRQAARRHTRWVQSVDEDQLTGFGYAITLTTKLMADSPEELYDTLHKWWNRQKAAGAIRAHWVRENHQDGRPHYHLGVYFDHQLTAKERAIVVRDWVECASSLRPASVGQDVKPMPRHRGWGQYCAKHSARSVTSYQRTGMPQGWSRCGRLWGHFGDWPLVEDKYVVDGPTALVLRRLLLGWRREDAASSLQKARAAAAAARSVKGQRQAAHHVKCAERRQVALDQMEKNVLSKRRGIAEWTERAEALRLLRVAADEADGFVALLREDIDPDGVVLSPVQFLRSGAEGPGRELVLEDQGDYDELPNALTPDRDALLALNAPTAATVEQLASGAIFALERKARRGDRKRCEGSLATSWQRRQHRAVAAPEQALERRYAAQVLLGLASGPLPA